MVLACLFVTALGAARRKTSKASHLTQRRPMLDRPRRNAERRLENNKNVMEPLKRERRGCLSITVVSVLVITPMASRGEKVSERQYSTFMDRKILMAVDGQGNRI